MKKNKGKKCEVRRCRYKYCLHDTKTIDKNKDEFIKNKSAYYHKDCYEQKLKNDYKETTTDTYGFSELKQNIFKCTKIGYTDAGRINYMRFEQIK